MYWSYLDTGTGGGILYCNTSGRANPGPITIENAMVYSGKDYGGHKLFNTSVPGLYYTMLISRVWSAYDTITDIQSPGIYIGDPSNQEFSFPSQTAIYKLRVATKQTTTISFGLLVV